MWMEAAMAQFKAIPVYVCMDEVSKNTKPSGKMVCIPAEIRTRHLLVQVRELPRHPP